MTNSKNPVYSECIKVLKTYPISDILIANRNATSHSLNARYGFSLTLCESLLFFIPKKRFARFQDDLSIKSINSILGDIRSNCDDIAHIVTRLKWQHNKSSQTRARLLLRIYNHLLKNDQIKLLIQLEDELNTIAKSEPIFPSEYTILQDIESNLKVIKQKFLILGFDISKFSINDFGYNTQESN